jgi:hypothetical protein
LSTHPRCSAGVSAGSALPCPRSHAGPCRRGRRRYTPNGGGRPRPARCSSHR